MPALVANAYLKLILCELDLARGRFEELYNKVRNHPIREQAGQISIADITSAVDRACIWYWKEVLCLQRSTVTTCLLREHGIAAVLVIGAQQMPFRAHAWVEVDGRATDGRSDTYRIYAILDRC